MANYVSQYTGADIDARIAKVDEIITELSSLLGEDDKTSFIDTFNEMKKFFDGIKNSETLQNIKDELDDFEEI